MPTATDPTVASLHPELVLLAVLAHADEPAAAGLLEAVPQALGALDGELGPGYLAMLFAALSPLLRARLEALTMANAALADYPLPPFLEKFRNDMLARGKAEGQAQGKAEGKAEAVLRILEARGLAVSDRLRERVLACTDVATLDRWIARAALASSAAAAVRMPRPRRRA